MRPYNLFNHLRSVDYHTTGKNLDWRIEVDNVENKIRVMFQESNQNSDWFFNFCFPFSLTIIGGMPYIFSSGWWICWCSSKELILHTIMKCWVKYPDYEIEICGYSFGGAIAQICGVEVYERLGIKPSLITFGSPKPFFLLWSKFMARRCFKSITQYAHRSDIVTWCVPLPSYFTVKNTRLGKFNIKDLFNPLVYHQIYGEKSIYENL